MYLFDTSVGGEFATSYATLQDATNYLTARGNSSAFFALDQSDQEQRLIYGTMQLDLMSVYDGTIADSETPQALGWPRVNAEDCEGLEQDVTSIPDGIINAAIELSLYQAEADRISTPSLLGKGIRRAKAGPLEVEADVSLRFDLVSRNVEIQLGCLGSIKAKAKFNGTTNGIVQRA